VLVQGADRVAVPLERAEAAVDRGLVVVPVVALRRRFSRQLDLESAAEPADGLDVSVRSGIIRGRHWDVRSVSLPRLVL